jgi:hypothetical protein
MSIRLAIDKPLHGVIKSKLRTVGALAGTVNAPPEARVAITNILGLDPGAEAYRFTLSALHGKGAGRDAKRRAVLLRCCPTEIPHKVGGVLLRCCRIAVGYLGRTSATVNLRRESRLDRWREPQLALSLERALDRTAPVSLCKDRGTSWFHLDAVGIRLKARGI